MMGKKVIEQSFFKKNRSFYLIGAHSIKTLYWIRISADLYSSSIDK